MIRSPSTSNAFTLLEALIALSLGLVILLTTYAGFRVASQSITTAERKALENKLLIAGVMIVLDDADLWTDLDNPGDATQQPLRTRPSKVLDPENFNYSTDGSDWEDLPQPFTAFGSTTTANSSWDLSGATADFDPDRWHPHNESSWYRGDGALYFATRHSTDNSAYGNYALATASEPVSSFYPSGPPTTVHPTDTWLASQQKGLKYSLGYYGWFDYLPAQAMVDYYDVSGGEAMRPVELRERWQMTESDWGGPDLNIVSDDATYVWNVSPNWHGKIASQLFWPKWSEDRNTGMPTLNRSGNERVVSRGSFLRDTHTAISGPIIDPATRLALGENSTSDRYRSSLNRMVIGTYGHGWEPMSAVTALIQSANREAYIIDEPPDAWPTVQVGMRRVMHMGNVTSYAFVRMVDPVSGVSEEMFLPVLSSSLRGARLNRGLD